MWKLKLSRTGLARLNQQREPQANAVCYAKYTNKFEELTQTRFWHALVSLSCEKVCNDLLVGVSSGLPLCRSHLPTAWAFLHSPIQPPGELRQRRGPGSMEI